MITDTAAGAITRLAYSGAGNTVASDGLNTYSRDPGGTLVGVGTANPGGGTVAGSGLLAFTDQHSDVVGQFSATGTALTGSASYDPLGNPIGRHYGLGDNKPENDVTVIGVVKDVKFDDLAEETVNLDYIPYTQHPWGFGDFEVRYAGAFAPVAAAVQQTIHSIDRTLPITRVTTLDEQVARSITNQRLVAQLSAFFGLLAAFLSCIGIYGVMSYVVTRRTNEIGIRMALGAGRSNMLWMMLREILILVSIGLVIGVPVTLAGNRLVSNMLFGLRPTDPVTLVSATVMLLIVAAIAGYLPARRASRVDPMVALRYE